MLKHIQLGEHKNYHIYNKRLLLQPRQKNMSKTSWNKKLTIIILPKSQYIAASFASELFCV